MYALHAISALALLAVASVAAADPKDARIVDLRDGYVRVETTGYSIEIPRGWKVGEETQWGQRKADAPKGSGELGVMTAGPTRATWDDLYRTSLWFIQREEAGKATPYEVSKTQQGYEAASFSVLDKEGFAARRYVLVRAKDGRVLALSVRIPEPKAEREFARHFDRLVATARLTDRRG